jgi:hypothetical protein
LGQLSPPPGCISTACPWGLGGQWRQLSESFPITGSVTLQGKAGQLVPGSESLQKEEVGLLSLPPGALSSHQLWPQLEAEGSCDTWAQHEAMKTERWRLGDNAVNYNLLV